MAATDVEISAEAGGEPEPDRLEHRVEPHRHPLVGEPFDRVVEAFERGRHIGHDDHLAAPVGRGRHVGGVDRQHERSPRAGGRRDLPRLEAVDRHGEALGHEHPHRVTRALPHAPGIAAHVDPVGAGVAQPMGLSAEFRHRHPRGMVDLGDDLDVEGPVGREIPRLLAKVFVEAAEILGAAVNGQARHRGAGVERPAAGAGQDDAGRAGGHLQPTGDPGRRHQGGHGDVHHLHRVLEADPRRQPLEHLPQRVLGQLAGDEMNAVARGGHE
jgi:hypothetical protein